MADMSANCRSLIVMNLGVTDFEEIYQVQKTLVKLRWEKQIPDVLILNEHKDVYTLGRQFRTQGKPDFQNIPSVSVDRGGDVTFHGPGQMVVYPIFYLPDFKKDVHYFIRLFENICLEFLLLYGVKGILRKGFTGIWLDDTRKIISMGFGFSHWVSFHGLGINLDTTLERFNRIQPCGLEEIRMVNLLDCTKEISRKNGYRKKCASALSRLIAQSFGYTEVKHYHGSNSLSEFLKDAHVPKSDFTNKKNLC